jgi:hypothetical protein
LADLPTITLIPLWHNQTKQIAINFKYDESVKEYIKNLVVQELKNDDELDEVSTTATAGIDGTGTGHYDTPRAFASGSQGGHPNPEVVGYKKVNEALNDKGVKEFKRELALDVKYVKSLSKLINKKSVGKVTEKDDQLISSLTNLLQGRFSGLANMLKNKSLNEGRYHEYRNDESLTPKQKIGRSMREIRDALNELDKTVKMNLKLKTELNMKSEDYWKNTHKALTKISERLVKMANKVGNLK